jgi:hypothetical protein
MPSQEKVFYLPEQGSRAGDSHKPVPVFPEILYLEIKYLDIELC